MQGPFSIAADLDTPVSAFLKLAPLDPVFLLESVIGGTQVARHSFVGFDPAFALRIAGDVATITAPDGAVRTLEVPGGTGVLDVLRQVLADAPVLEPALPDVPFRGGLVGATPYDLVRRFEPVGDGPIADGPHYVAPRAMLVFDHVTRRAAVVCAGPESERRALEARVTELLAGPVPARGRGTHVGAPVQSLSDAAFLERVAVVKEHLAAGDVFQLVLSVRFEGATDLDPVQVYRALRLLNPSPYMVLLRLGARTIVGSSPEALVRLQPDPDGAMATLRPIAGTRPRGGTPADDARHAADLLADPKEAAEHVMLVDLARNDLGRVAVPGTIVVEPYRSVEHYSHVMHLVSGVSGRVRSGTDAFDLFAATFPAGTVVGAPKVRAMQILDGLEPVPRGVYAGTVGWFGHGDAMDQAIAIRTLVFDRDADGSGRYAWQAGAGLVADSDPEAELREVHAKSGALAAALALAAEGL